MFVVYNRQHKEMIKKYSIAIGLTIALFSILIAILLYPGGTYENKNSIGFDWQRNYFCNLFETNALNVTNLDI